MAIEGKDYEDLKQAVVRLEFHSFISKITSYIEKPVGKIIDSLPVGKWGTFYNPRVKYFF